jgi:hypothetical protein
MEIRPAELAYDALAVGLERPLRHQREQAIACGSAEQVFAAAQRRAAAGAQLIECHRQSSFPAAIIGTRQPTGLDAVATVPR